MLHKIQIYLDETQYQYVLSLAGKHGASVAQIFRDLIEADMAARSCQGEEDPFFRVIGIGEGNGEPVAENYKDFLYGEDAKMSTS